MIFIYNLSIRLYVFAIRLSAWTGNPKAKRWLDGRRGWRIKISEALKPGEQRVWFHCSSLGEFEQGRPVMEQWKERFPEQQIVLTFFSPSGYEVRKNYPGADYIFYLPADTKGNASDFISLVEPEKVFFTKYEYWHHYFRTLKQKGIPLYMISAIFRPGDRYFRWYGGFFRNMLRCVTQFFVQDELSSTLLSGLGFSNVTIAGDTRFDRVVELAEKAADIPVVQQFAGRSKVLVAGSTWSEDEKIIAAAFGNMGGQLKLIIAPHEINPSRMEEIIKIFSGYKIIRYAEAPGQDLSAYNILLIDNIGMLSSLYKYGSCAYIGGGFGKGIHNTLEAAVYGLQVFFGARFEKFIEAKELIQCGGASTISGSEDLTLLLKNVIDDEAENKRRGAASAQYVRGKAGATKRILGMVSQLE